MLKEFSMKHHTIITITIIVIIGLLILLAATFFRNLNPVDELQPSTEWPAEVDWPTAIEILHSGQVTEVVQAHNLEVKLVLKEGTQIKTIEPTIDEIFIEIQLCGDICSEILLITE
jgi:hypothetical protein